MIQKFGAVPPPASFRGAPTDIAYLQLTSGSTGKSKATVIAHRNLLANVRSLAHRSFLRHGDVCATWLPAFHDFGLVFSFLMSFLSGVDLFAMLPSQFVRNPFLWVKMISDSRATHIAAPNFGYNMAAERVSEAQVCPHSPYSNHPPQVATLNLSSVEVAATGAEPVREHSLRAFFERFRSVGIRKEIFCPGYGLAESVLGCCMTLSTRDSRIPLPYLLVVKASIQPGGIARVVGEGVVADGTAPIVPSDCALLIPGGPTLVGCNFFIADALNSDKIVRIDGDDRLGEIIISGDSVAVGYLGDGKKLKETFGGVLRTGDLGFSHGGQLYIAERIKNIIIRNGSNYLPSNIEYHLGAALGVDSNKIIVQPLRPPPPSSPQVFESDLAVQDSDIVAAIDADFDELIAKDSIDLKAFAVHSPPPCADVRRPSISPSRALCSSSPARSFAPPAAKRRTLCAALRTRTTPSASAATSLLTSFVAQS